MASIAIRVSGLDVDTASTFTINFEVLPQGGGVVTGSVTVPFASPLAIPEDSYNFGIIGVAKAIAASHGFPVGDGDAVRLLGGMTRIPQSSSGQQVAHVVMKGTAVDSVFTDDAAAQARAGALATATDGAPQDEALKAAPWIATAPMDPE